MKIIPRYPNYSATEDGDIYSHISDKVLSPSNREAGYLRAILRKDGKTHYEDVHRLVAEAYHGYQEGLLVDHIDLNRKNNKPENLRWVTDEQSMLNRTNTIYVEYEGEVGVPLIEICRRFSSDDNFYRKVRYRLLNGWALTKAIEHYMDITSHNI